MEGRARLELMLTLIVVLLTFGVLYIAQGNMNSFYIRVLNLAAIYAILALSLNLILGFTGMFSLGHAGFMCIGSYVAAILTMSPASKEIIYFMEPIHPWLANVEWPIWPAILLGGIIAALFGFLIGFPALRLRDDYLAIATLGFAEIIRIVVTNVIPITNGALGLKNIPSVDSLLVYWGCAIITIFVLMRIINSSWGYAFKAIRDNEIASQAMGINIFKHKLMSLPSAPFFAGIAGALMSFLITSIDPTMYRFTFTFRFFSLLFWEEWELERIGDSCSYFFYSHGSSAFCGAAHEPFGDGNIRYTGNENGYIFFSPIADNPILPARVNGYQRV